MILNRTSIIAGVCFTLLGSVGFAQNAETTEKLVRNEVSLTPVVVNEAEIESQKKEEEKEMEEQMRIAVTRVHAKPVVVSSTKKD